MANDTSDAAEIVRDDLFRNAEVHTLANGKLKSVEVFFGDPPLGIAREDFFPFIENGKKTWKKSSA